MQTLLDEKKKTKITLKLKEKLDDLDMSIGQFSVLTGLKFEVVERYYTNKIQRTDRKVLETFCDTLNCPLSDLMDSVLVDENE